MASSQLGGSSARFAVFAFAFLGALIMVHASDADPLQDFCVADMSANAPRVTGFSCRTRSSVTPNDFVFTGLRKIADTSSPTGTGAAATLATASEFPGINTQGLAHGVLDFAIGGVIPPHTHPRASETLFVLKGTVYTGFVSADNVLYASTLQPGDLTVFPRGMLHFQINVGNETARTFNSLNSQNPGILVSANQMFETKIPSAVLEKSFGISARTVKNLQASIPRFWG